MANRKKMPVFWKVYIVYVLLFVLLAAAALQFLYFYMAAYENAGSKGFMREYMSQLKQGEVSESLVKQLEGLDENIRSRDESLSMVKELITDASYFPVPGEQTEGAATMAIYSGGQQLGTVKIKFSGEEKLGFEIWELAEETWDLSPLIKSEHCYLPKDYTLCVGNAEYDAGNDSKEYDALDYAYSRYDGMPYMYSYESGRYLMEADVKVLDSSGNVLEQDQLSEQYFLNNCDEQLYEKLASFGETFVNNYVNFGAVNGGNFFWNFGQLKSVMSPGSEVWDRITSSWGGIFYGRTEYCKILDLKVNICSKLNEEYYLVDVSYDTETKASADAVFDDNYVRLIAIEDKLGHLVAVSMYNY